MHACLCKFGRKVVMIECMDRWVTRVSERVSELVSERAIRRDRNLDKLGRRV